MMISAKPNVTMKPPDLLHVLPAQAAVIDRIALRQRARRQVLQIVASASPCATPGMATPWMVALLSCWKWLSDSGTVLVTMLATVDSGTSAPSRCGCNSRATAAD
jgi:hypothetical protein